MTHSIYKDEALVASDEFLQKVAVRPLPLKEAIIAQLSELKLDEVSSDLAHKVWRERQKQKDIKKEISGYRSYSKRFWKEADAKAASKPKYHKGFQGQNSDEKSHRSYVEETEHLDEGKMGDLYSTISGHLDRHINEYKKRGGAEALANHVDHCVNHVAKVHQLPLVHARKFVNDYCDHNLGESNPSENTEPSCSVVNKSLWGDEELVEKKLKRSRDFYVVNKDLNKQAGEKKFPEVKVKKHKGHPGRSMDEETELDEKYIGFKKMVRGGMSPALAGWIGHKKYGKDMNKSPSEHKKENAEMHKEETELIETPVTRPKKMHGPAVPGTYAWDKAHGKYKDFTKKAREEDKARKEAGKNEMTAKIQKYSTPEYKKSVGEKVIEYVPGKSVYRPDENNPPFDPDKPHGPHAVAGKRGYGYSISHHLARMGLKKAEKETNEGTELNELSKDTLGSYIKKASLDSIVKGFCAGQNSASGNQKESDKLAGKFGRRWGYITKAVNRLTSKDSSTKKKSSKGK